MTPIASLTKLMTALVVFDAQQSLDEVIKITAEDRWKGKGAFSHLPQRREAHTPGSAAPRVDGLGEPRRARLWARNYPGGVAGVRQDDEHEGEGVGDDTTRSSDPSGLSSSQHVDRAGSRQSS